MNSYLSNRFPTLLINGSDYPVPAAKALLSKLVTLVQYALYALLFAGQMIFDKLGVTPPALYYRLVQNKVVSFFIIMIVVGNISSSFLATGAFEIQLNNQIIFSKLQTGRMPDIQEIENILRNQGI